MAENTSLLSRQWMRAERAALARARGKKKLDVVYDAADPQGLVRSLPAEDLYFAVQEIGKSDAGPLVQLASPEQFRAFVDLDAWKGDTLDTSELLLWVRLARGEDDDAYREKLAVLDIEVLELLLRGIVQIFDLEEEGEPGDDVDGTIERTVEGRFMLVYNEEGVEYAAARRVIQELYADDPFKAARMLYAVRWELESELSETAYRWRNARMADLGFPSPEEAVSLYARLDRKQALPPPGGAPASAPGFFLAEFERGSLLDRAMGLVPDDARDALQLQILAVLNAAIVADRIDVSDLDAVHEQVRAVRETLALGLADLAGGEDPVQASALLATVAPKKIFQAGFTRTLELKWRAEKMVKALPIRLPGAVLPLPEMPDAEALAALLRRRPRYHGGLDGPAAPQRERPFATLADLQRGCAALERIEAVAQGFAQAGLQTDAAAPHVVAAWGEAGLARVRWGELFATAAAREAIGLPWAFEPLPAARLGDALRAIFDEDGRLLPAFRSTALERWQERTGGGDAPRFFADAALARLEGELGPQVNAEGFDAVEARFAAPLIVPG
ncbi:DUF6178 family protein [Vulgatibacter sp.]|uniref:DUF6178 family protein n=1 Tax=Vulgatibacter sp. TaxID=1971226 RepID=UPI00356625A4